MRDNPNMPHGIRATGYHYISMSIYRCFCLDYDLKLPDFKTSRTEALINAFVKMSVAHLLGEPILLPAHRNPLPGSASRQHRKFRHFFRYCQVLFHTGQGKSNLESTDLIFFSCAIALMTDWIIAYWNYLNIIYRLQVKPVPNLFKFVLFAA